MAQYLYPLSLGVAAVVVLVGVYLLHRKYSKAICGEEPSAEQTPAVPTPAVQTPVIQPSVAELLRPSHATWQGYLKKLENPGNRKERRKNAAMDRLKGRV